MMLIIMNAKTNDNNYIMQVWLLTLYAGIKSGRHYGVTFQCKKQIKTKNKNKSIKKNLKNKCNPKN